MKKQGYVWKYWFPVPSVDLWNTGFNKLAIWLHFSSLNRSWFRITAQHIRWLIRVSFPLFQTNSLTLEQRKIYIGMDTPSFIFKDTLHAQKKRLSSRGATFIYSNPAGGIQRVQHSYSLKKASASCFDSLQSPLLVVSLLLMKSKVLHSKTPLQGYELIE